MATRLLIAGAAVVLGLGGAACRSDAPKEDAAPAETPAASTDSHEGHQAAKVTFAEPKDGATVGTLTKFVFQSDNYQISPVPQGEVKEARANMGHFHLGVDTDCLPAGTVIPKANPWVHFGMGNNTIEMQLTPGSHKLVVQAGDDRHATMTGLCETITVNVTE